MGVISHLVYKALIHQTLTNQYNGKQKESKKILRMARVNCNDAVDLSLAIRYP